MQALLWDLFWFTKFISHKSIDLDQIFWDYKPKMNDMKKDTYTLWIDDELVATREHTREGYNELLADACEHQGKAACEIYSSRDDQAVWQSDQETGVPMTYEEAYGCDYEPTPQEYYEPSCYDGTYSEM